MKKELPKSMQMLIQKIEDKLGNDEKGKVINRHNERESKLIEELISKNEMFKEIAEKGLSLFVFVITDVVNSNSEAIVLGERSDAISKEYELNDNIAVMPGVVSRKKQILPLVEKNI